MLYFIHLSLVLASLKGPVKVDPPIKTHEELINRIESKFIGNDAGIALGAGAPPGCANIDWVTPEYRPIVVDYLKAKAKDPRYLERAQRVLIALGDEDTIAGAIDQYDDGTIISDSIIWQNLKPAQIQYWVLEIYQGSDVDVQLWPGFKQSKRRMAVGYLLDTVGINEGSIFPVPATQWAGHLHYNTQKIGNDPHIIWLFQQWWEHNKDAVLVGKFSEATWVPMYKGQPDVFGEDVRNEPEYRNYSSASRNDILPIPKHASIISNIKTAPPATKAGPVASPVAAPVPKNNSLLAILAFGLLAIVTAVWAWSRRSKAN